MNLSTTINPATWILLFSCWLLASIATLGSLFFSEVMQFQPCVLCWYQRICMYPLVLIFLVGLLSKDKGVFKYSMPLVISGWIIALYHNLLNYEILPESAAPCLQGVPCTAEYINWFGFVTIPLLSSAAFSFIFILLILFKKKVRS